MTHLYIAYTVGTKDLPNIANRWFCSILFLVKNWAVSYGFCVSSANAVSNCSVWFSAPSAMARTPLSSFAAQQLPSNISELVVDATERLARVSIYSLLPPAQCVANHSVTNSLMPLVMLDPHTRISLRRNTLPQWRRTKSALKSKHVPTSFHTMQFHEDLST